MSKMVQLVMVMLGAEELEIRKAELAKLPEQINEAREIANAERAKHREKIKELEDRRDELVGIVTSSKEPRERKVEERPGLVAGAVELVDVETGEVVAPAKAITKGDGPLFDKAKIDTKRTARKGEGKAKGRLDVADNANEAAPIGEKFSTGEPAIGIGEDGKEYELDVVKADMFRNGKTPEVQGEKGMVAILSLKKPPKKGKKANGASAEAGA